MGTSPRLAAYAVALIVAFGAAFGLGRAVGPVDEPGPDTDRVDVEQPTPVHDGHGSGS